MNWKQFLTNPFGKKEKPVPPPAPVVEEAKPAPEPEPQPEPTPVPAEPTPPVYKRPRGRPRKDAPPPPPEVPFDGPKGSWIRPEEQKKLVATMLAHFKSPYEIQAEFRRLYQVEMPYSTIASYRGKKKWKGYIQAERDKYLMGLDNVPGAHKRVRMERREMIYEKSMIREDFKNALSAVRDQENEIEGKQRQMNFTLNQYNGLTDEELEEKRLELMKTITIPAPKES